MRDGEAAGGSRVQLPLGTVLRVAPQLELHGAGDLGVAGLLVVLQKLLLGRGEQGLQGLGPSRGLRRLPLAPGRLA